jgi:hypothetical protein
MKMYSAQPSFFSKKRVESGIAFIIAQWGMIFFLIKSYSTITMTETVVWATTEFAIAGYILKQIQKEKQTDTDQTISEQQNISDQIIAEEQNKSDQIIADKLTK